ncbi:MAG: hypothetical protein ACQEQD_02850 [Bacillota bacterium]
MRIKDSFEKYLAIEDKNYKREMQERNQEKVKREMFNMSFM